VEGSVASEEGSVASVEGSVASAEGSVASVDGSVTEEVGTEVEAVLLKTPSTAQVISVTIIPMAMPTRRKGRAYFFTPCFSGFSWFLVESLGFFIVITLFLEYFHFMITQVIGKCNHFITIRIRLSLQGGQ
jgi:hypothetical protein